ncbi:recombinase family protein [Wolbachia pipientis]|uniref:recombinase family protein n=1 Tax=Wolbachia pipientis TaxID=955 RepID=UPI0015F83C1C|nr:recombinase family protein [Wolbachia pipientis]MBA8769672.1 recombinase family protein [Wolbachia pipientis]
MNTSELITAQHFTREAIIYIRQSTPHQALSNQESLELQYALKQRAIDLGWKADNIVVIDNDLGLTGASAEKREGYKEILAKVTLSKVGIILSYDVTRLSRNCSDWYPLLDICGYKQCLIADRDGVYDPGTINGRLLLGLKGQLAEMELSTIRARLNAGLVNKATRGDLALSLPVGFVRNIDDSVSKDPNLEVQQHIKLVFDTFLEKRTAAQVVRYFNNNQLTIPRYDNFKEVHWKKPTFDAIISMLKNPAYAGAFAYGRSCTTRHKLSSANETTKRLPMKEWKVLIKDKYPAYIDWETFTKIQIILKDNHADYRRCRTRGIARPGAALLHGIIYCGKCGHKMIVQYKGGNHYKCSYQHQRDLSPSCQFLPADIIDNEVVPKFFAALSQIELDAYTKAINSQLQSEQEINKAHLQQLERLRYQVRLAERQFNQVDPDNRLVAAELERRWEQALNELKQAEITFERQYPSKPTPQLSEELKIIFLDVGKKLPEIWHKSVLSRQQRKSFIRCLIDKVIAHRISRDCLQIRIVWHGRETTTFHVPIPVSSFRALTTATEMEQSIIKLSKEGKTDIEIAKYLETQGYRSPSQSKNIVLENTVKNIRLKNNIMRKKEQSHPIKVPGYLTISQIAKILEVSRQWLCDRIRRGKIKIQKDYSKTRGKYLFEDTPETVRTLMDFKNGKLNNPNFL